MSSKLASVPTAGCLSETTCRARAAGPFSGKNPPQGSDQGPSMLDGWWSGAAHARIAASASKIHGAGCRGELGVARGRPLMLWARMAGCASACKLDERVRAQRTPSQRAAPSAPRCTPFDSGHPSLGGTAFDPTGHPASPCMAGSWLRAGAVSSVRKLRGFDLCECWKGGEVS
jgi:hypothetical protein